jgi:cytochrome c-type biogenesis protein CcsB
MKMMGALTVIFAFVIAVATFIENDYGTLGAKAAVYNAKWFEVLLILLTLNLIGNIYRYKLYTKDKLPLFVFHVAFVFVLVGAGITRYIGYEGVMSIDEGKSSNSMISESTYLHFTVEDNQSRYDMEKKVLFSELTDNSFEDNLEFGAHNVSIKYVKFLQDAVENIVEDKAGKPILELVVSDGSGRERMILNSFDMKRVAGKAISFGNLHYDDVLIRSVNGELSIKSKEPIATMKMADGSKDFHKANEFVKFEGGKLYTIGKLNIVLQNYYPYAKTELVKVKKSSAHAGKNALVLEIKNNDKKQNITLFGAQGLIGERKVVHIDGVNVWLSYGSKEIKLPFEIRLDDFILERYAGSMSPSSYESHVTLIDKAEGIEKPFRIYMNHILEHKGYRFYQSSYKPDESATVLSVNHDYWGTLITYIGYTLMIIGFIWIFFTKNSRFAQLSKKSNKIAQNRIIQSLVAVMLLFGANHAEANAQPKEPTSKKVVDLEVEMKKISKAHAEKFGKLLVQSRDGRIKPLDTLAREVIRKVSRKDSFYNLTPIQVFLGMLSRPNLWQSIKIIRVSNKELQEELGLDGKYAALTDIIKPYFGKTKYMLADKVEEINRKKPSLRSKYDNEVLKVDERVNIAYMVFSGTLLRVFPKPNDPNNTWYDPMSVMKVFEPKDQGFVTNVFFRGYFPSFDAALASGDFSEADKYLGYISDFQQRAGSAIVPDSAKISLELLYNKYNVFKNLMFYFGLIGFVLLVILIVHIIKPSFKVDRYVSFGLALITIGFLIQTLGLATRWYISGHAPWSDAYESLVYISWAIVLAGFIFVKRSQITLAATSLLAALTLMVAHLNWLEPEITNLVPVLKSYWLVIHVAVITASYGFLALGALLGFISLILMISKNHDNHKRINLTIKELTYINEMSLIIGLVLLTIGNFLGGVWANESWGRYWGWDPKETWALVTILVYTFVVHMRFIPALKSVYTFNVVSLVSFASVIMTYFGVNFYLSGLHSYAKGDPVPIPTFVYVSIAVVFIVSVIAYFKDKKHNNYNL